MSAGYRSPFKPHTSFRGEHLSAVRAQEVTAGLRQSPTGVLSSQMVTLSPNDPNGTEFYAAGMQRLFERGNKRQLRLDTARSTTSPDRNFQLDDQRRQMDLSIRQAFSRMLYAQDALAISRDNLEGYRKTVALMKVRLDAGDIDATDFDRVELQLAGFESDQDNAALYLFARPASRPPGEHSSVFLSAATVSPLPARWMRHRSQSHSTTCTVPLSRTVLT